MAASLTKVIKAAAAETRTHTKLLVGINMTLCIAVIIFSVESYAYNGTYGNSYAVTYTSPALGVVIFAATALCGFFICPSVFKELNNANAADVSFSLPLSSTQRYASKLVTLVLVHILPIVFWGAAAYTAALVTLPLAETLGSAKDVLGTMAAILLPSVLFTDAISVFCCCSCGSRAESVYFSIITAVCISIEPYLFTYHTIDAYSGFSDPKMGGGFALWSYSIAAVLYKDDSSAVLLSLLNCLISALLIAVCVLLYKRRDAASVGKPIVIRILFELMTLFGIFTVLTCTEYYIVAPLYGLVIAFIAHMIIHIAVSRAKTSVLRFFGWILKYAAYAAVFFAVLFIGYATNGFNYKISAKETGGSYSLYAALYENDKCRHLIYECRSADDINEMMDAVYDARSDSEKSLGGFISSLYSAYYCSDYYYYYSVGDTEDKYYIIINLLYEYENEHYEDQFYMNMTLTDTQYYELMSRLEEFEPEEIYEGNSRAIFLE